MDANIQNILIFTSIALILVGIVTLLFILIKKQLRIRQVRKHLAANYVVECQDLHTRNETKLLLKRINQDYLQSYNQKNISYTTSL